MTHRCDETGCDRPAAGYVDVHFAFGTGKLPLCERHHPGHEVGADG